MKTSTTGTMSTPSSLVLLSYRPWRRLLVVVCVTTASCVWILSSSQQGVDASSLRSNHHHHQEEHSDAHHKRHLHHSHHHHHHLHTDIEDDTHFLPLSISKHGTNDLRGLHEGSGIRRDVALSSSSTGKTWFCDPVKRNWASTLDSMRALKVGLADPDSPVMPFVRDATDVPGAKKYVYNDFYIRPVYFEGMPYQGKCTLVFAWLSTPVQHSSTSTVEGNTPGVVLLHGGGGTAHREWVEKWASEGFASIAMGLEGQTSNGDFVKGYSRTPYPGPKRSGMYNDYLEPLQDQWMYHAVSISMIANTLLRAQPEVNNKQIGVVGDSWGGVITATLLPYDHERYAFAILGYGCGSLTLPAAIGGGTIGREIRAGGPDKIKYYEDVWDPSPKLGLVQIPTLWISSPTDPHFPIEAQTKTIQSLHPMAPVWIADVYALKHGFFPMIDRPENYVFARTVVDSQPPEFTPAQFLPTQTNQHSMTVDSTELEPEEMSRQTEEEGPHMLFTASLRLPRPPIYVSLLYSESSLNIATNQREWLIETAAVKNRDPVTGALTGKGDGKGREAPSVQFWVEHNGCDPTSATIDGHILQPCLWSITVSLPVQKVTSWYVTARMKDDIVASSRYNDMSGMEAW